MSSENSDVFQLVLKNGHYYEDVITKDNNKMEFAFAQADFDTSR